jgi:hypothetical protein
VYLLHIGTTVSAGAILQEPESCETRGSSQFLGQGGLPTGQFKRSQEQTFRRDGCQSRLPPQGMIRISSRLPNGSKTLWSVV